jgi:hypothetical protein
MIKHSGLLLILVILTLSSSISTANTPDSTRRLTLSLGVYQVTSEEVSYRSTAAGGFVESPLPTAVANIKISYEAVNNLDIGGYLAYSNMNHRVPSVDSNDYYFSSNTLFYGLLAQYDVLPILTGKNNLRFSLKATAKMGMVSAKWSELEGVNWVKNWNGPFLEYGIGLGAGYFFTKRLGININYSVGKFYNKDNSRMYLGISYRI